MSGVIPMVSASPPPFEEDGGDDWDADFGNFMGADHNVSGHSESENWAAFPDSAPVTEKRVSPSNLSQENEYVPPTETELKLDINCSNVVSSSDSGLELDGSNITDSVSQEYRQGMELQIDSGLCSTEVSPCDPVSRTCNDKDSQSLSTLTVCDFPEQSSQSSNDDSNDKSEENSASEIRFSKSENIETSISLNQMDHCSESFEKDAEPDSVRIGDSDDNEKSVQDISTNQECKDSVVEDPSSIDLKSENSEAIQMDDNDDWGDFGEVNENINSATSEILGTDQINEKSKSILTNNTEELFSESQEDLSTPKLESEENINDLPKCTEEISEEKENLEEEIEAINDIDDKNSEVGKDRNSVDEDAEDDFSEANFTAPDADWTPALREDMKGLDSEEEEENLRQLDNSEKNASNKDMENTDDQRDIDNTQSETNVASGLEDDDDDDDFNDFADFGSTPSNDLEFKKEEFNIDDRQEKNEDDFNDFADFGSAPSNDLETKKDNEPSSQFASFSEDSAANNDGNWASFQETSDNGEAKDADWLASKDNWSNNDAQGGDQWKEGGDDEWQEGGGDDFGDFEDFDDEPTRPIQKEKVDELSNRAVSSCFHRDASDVDAGDHLSALYNYVQNKDSESSPEKSFKVWGSLTKQATESPLKWSQSRSNKQLFSSLKIDTRNILIGHKKPSVPIYASNLTLLEPTKGPAKPTKPEPTLVDTNKEEPQKQDIPPVQFDWSTSGLVNPLQGDSSKSLDLDFLVVQETETGGRSGEWDWVFDSELMHGQKPNLQPLENILANLKVSTVKKNRQTDKLGAEATKIIKTLPDLSFMQAKVLMFPIRHQAE
ncbi:aftiphilin-like [Saccostrea echinata]|uniref:aftiphilin-like n=1 Tax=Saccostrea echinata TaxID=191078 RepID=UPI002A81C5AF|nr:aftiphilin-like [Saccostrea echinata]